MSSFSKPNGGWRRSSFVLKSIWFTWGLTKHVGHSFSLLVRQVAKFQKTQTTDSTTPHVTTRFSQAQNGQTRQSKITPKILRHQRWFMIASRNVDVFFWTQRTKPSSLICKPEFVTTSIDLQFFLHLERSVCETSHRINALITFHHGHFTCVVCLQQALQQPLSHPLVVSSTDGHEVNKLFQPSEMVTRLVWCVGKNGCLMLFVV